MTASYNQQEFFRVGYYVNNYYEDPEMNENPPQMPALDKLTRHILAEKPRVTKFQIDWDVQEDQQQMMMQNGMFPMSSDQMLMNGGNNENMNYGNMMGMNQVQLEEGLLQKGTQFQDRNEMMSMSNLAEAAQNFKQ